MSTPEWLMHYGDRIAGGGPATTNRGGVPLVSLSPDANDPEASILDPVTGQPKAWDWSQSGVIENNCFLCHLEYPDNTARTAVIREGAFGWANTARITSYNVCYTKLLRISICNRCLQRISAIANGLYRSIKNI